MDMSNLLYGAMSVKVSVYFMFCAVFSIDESSHLYGSFLLMYSHLFLYRPGTFVLCA